jgi:type IV pilus assembly protein PilX
MTTRSRRIRPTGIQRRSAKGAALVVGLLLLLVLTLLAVSGMGTSTLELQMAGNQQYSEKAFQAAEVGIERAFRSGVYNTASDSPVPATLVTATDPDKNPETYKTTTKFNPATGVTAVPSGGFSMGVGAGYNAYHFDITSTGSSAREAAATNVQSFYVVGPSS